MNSEMVVDYDVTWWPGGGVKYIVCRMHRVRTALRPASVTLTRQIGSDKLISFTGDLGDLRIPEESLFDILRAGPPRFDSEESAAHHPLCSASKCNLACERLKIYI